MKIPISVEAGEIPQGWKHCLQLTCNRLMEYDREADEELSSEIILLRVSIIVFKVTFLRLTQLLEILKTLHKGEALT